MHPWKDEDYTRQCNALKLLHIDLDIWEGLTPESRKKSFLKIMKEGFKKYHPDKNRDLPVGSTEAKECADKFVLIKSIDFNYGAYYPTRESPIEHSHQASSDLIPPTFSPPWFDEEEDPIIKKFVEQGLKLLDQRAMESLKSVEFVNRSINSLHGSNFWEKNKELFVNTLSLRDSWKIFATSHSPSDYRFVLDQFLTKDILKVYAGHDVFVSALVSQNKARIKTAFDNMVVNIKKTWSILSFFSDDKKKIRNFIDCFCHFDNDRYHFDSITGETVMLLCHALELDLPYTSITTPYKKVDVELVRSELTKYVELESALSVLARQDNSNALVLF